jgi:DHA3 family macrolide efflux protein-like MFS transporter
MGWARRNRWLITLGIAESISGAGSWITMMAVLALLVFRGGGGVGATSGVFLAGLVPILVASPLAGRLVDRCDRRALLVLSELSCGLVGVGLLFADSRTAIYALLAVQALFSSVMMPARQAVVPQLVENDRITFANAFLQQLAGITKIGGPILGGALLAVLRPHLAILLDVISYGVAAMILFSLPALPPPSRESRGQVVRPRPARRSKPPAVSAVAGSPELRLLFGVVFLAVLVIIGFDSIGAVYVRDSLGAGEGFFGLTVGLIGAGTLIGSVGLMVARRRGDPWKHVLGGIVILAVLPFLLVVSGRVPGSQGARVIMGVGCLIGGVGMGLVHVQVFTLVQRLSPRAILGRMGGLLQGTMVGAQLIGLLVTPLLVPALMPATSYFAFAAAALVIVGPVGAMLVVRGRRSALRAAGGEVGVR